MASISEQLPPLSKSVLEMTVEEILKSRLSVNPADLTAICQQFQIVEMGLFGSALRDDFRVGGDDPSDVDLLVVFRSGYRLSWQDWTALESRLRSVFQREVDIVRKNLLNNPYRRAKILRSNRVIYRRALKDFRQWLEPIAPSNPFDQLDRSPVTPRPCEESCDFS